VPRIARRQLGTNNKPFIAVARAGEGQQIPRPSPMVPSWPPKKKRAGSELGRSFKVRSSIGRRSSGDQSDRVKLRSLIVLRPPCPTPRARCKKKKKRVGSELGRSFEVRSSIGRRSAGDQSDRVKLRSLTCIVLRPPCPTPRARCKKKKKRVGSELGRSFEVRSSELF
jgi:hypothetical protein